MKRFVNRHIVLFVLLAFSFGFAQEGYITTSRNMQFINPSFHGINMISKAGVNCTSELLEAKEKITLSEAILDYERRLNSDLIMIMTKKEESLSDSLSVTARNLIYHSEIPIMSIHPKSRIRRTKPTTAF